MKRKTKLIISVIIDLFGMITYAIPWIGELGDIIYAPFQAWWIYKAYGSKKAALLGGLEELLPFSDIIPSCTITHFLVKKKK